MYNRMLVTVCIHVTLYMYVLCHTLFREPTEHMGNDSNIKRWIISDDIFCQTNGWTRLPRLIFILTLLAWSLVIHQYLRIFIEPLARDAISGNKIQNRDIQTVWYSMPDRLGYQRYQKFRKVKACKGLFNKRGFYNWFNNGTVLNWNNF